MEIEFNNAFNSKDLSELALSTIDNSIQLSSEIIAVPGLNEIISTYKSIIDRIYLKKVFALLTNVRDHNWKERAKFINDLTDSSSSGAEKLLMSLSHIETIEKSAVFGRLCSLRISQKISLEHFHRLVKIIQDCFLLDLKAIFEINKDELQNSEHHMNGNGEVVPDTEYLKMTPLVSLGLVIKRDRYFSSGSSFGSKRRLKTVSSKYVLSELGEILYDNYEFLLPEST